MASNKETIAEYFHLALLDIRDGVSLTEMEEVLKIYERNENYLACAGIHKAIEYVKHKTIKNLYEDTKDNENAQRDNEIG